MIIDCVKAFFEECPLLKDGKINVNYLGSGGEAYSIEGLPCAPVIRRYVDGGEVRQFAFAFASREFYDEDRLRNMDTARFYEELCAWIESRNRAGELPAPEDGFKAERIEVTSTACIYSANAGTARFQIQCRLIYRK